jgi:hypothetical protein
MSNTQTNLTANKSNKLTELLSAPKDNAHVSPTHIKQRPSQLQLRPPGNRAATVAGSSDRQAQQMQPRTLAQLNITCMHILYTHANGGAVTRPSTPAHACALKPFCA